MVEGLNRVKQNGKWREATPEEKAAAAQGGKEFIAAIGANEAAGASPMLARARAQQQIAAAQAPGEAIAALKAAQDLRATNPLLNQVGVVPTAPPAQTAQTAQSTQTAQPNLNPIQPQSGTFTGAFGEQIMGQQPQGTIPSELAIPLTTGNLVVGSSMGGLTAIPRVAGATSTVTAVPTFESIKSGLTSTKALLGVLGVGSAGAVFGKLSGDRKQQVKVARAAITGSQNNMNNAIWYINHHPEDLQGGLMLYNQAWSDLYETERNLQILSKNDLPFFIESNGKDELQNIITMKNNKFILDQKVRDAYINPNANAVLDQVPAPQVTE